MSVKQDLEAFVEAECEVGDDYAVPFSTLFSAFEEWSRERGNEEISKRSVGIALGKLGFPVVRRAKARLRGGIRLKLEDRLPSDGEILEAVSAAGMTDEESSALVAALAEGGSVAGDGHDAAILRALARKCLADVQQQGATVVYQVFSANGTPSDRERISPKLEAALRLLKMIEPPPKPADPGAGLCPKCAIHDDTWQRMKELRKKRPQPWDGDQ